MASGSAVVEARPWTLRAYEAVALEPAWIGVGVGAAALGSFVALELALGRLQRVLAGTAGGLAEDVRLAIACLLLLAYVPTAYVYVLRALRGGLEELTPSLEVAPAELAALRREFDELPRARLRRWGCVAIVLGAASPFIADPTSLQPGIPTIEGGLHRVTAAFLGWLSGCFTCAVVVQSGRLHRLALAHLRVDLADPSSARPFVRQGMRTALLCIGNLSIVCLMSYDLGAAPHLGALLAVFAVATLAQAAVAILGPVLGVHRRLREKKDAELAWCGGEIARAREALGRRRTADPDALPLADLVAYQGFVRQAPSWPFDAPMRTRLALYLLLPLASWVAGALVERGINSLLGP